MMERMVGAVAEHSFCARTFRHVRGRFGAPDALGPADGFQSTVRDFPQSRVTGRSPRTAANVEGLRPHHPPHNMAVTSHHDLPQNAANYAPLTPISFLDRAAEVYPGKAAVVHGDRTFTYREFRERVRRLASVLAARGIGRGDTVAVMAPNVPALLEAHYAVPGIGAVLNALNYRLDPATIAFCLNHGEARVLIT